MGGRTFLQPLRGAGRLGCSRGVPRELGPIPWDVRPQCLRSRSPGPLGTEGPVRRALRGSWLPVQATGSRLRSLKRAALGWPARSLGYCLSQREGNPFSTPSLFSLPPTWAAPRCSSSALAGHRPQTTWVFFRRNSARSQAAPREPGIPAATHGTPFVPPSHPGMWGSACTRTSESVHSAFPSGGPSARLFVFLEGRL